MKKSMTKSLRLGKFLFVSQGPGETGQARALAKYVFKRGGKILFALNKKENQFFLEKDKEFRLFVTEKPEKLKELIEKEKPNFLLLFNSKMWGGELLEKSLFKKTFTFDSNWLFNEKRCPAFKYLKWANIYFILFPKKIFDLGLKERGGDFEIERTILKKIVPIGFIPSYKKPSQKILKRVRKIYKIQENEKFIFSYFSGWGAGHRIFALKNFVKAIDKLSKKKRRIKAIYIGPLKDLNLKTIKRDWLILKEKLSAKDFFLTLASSDLVFQHQGMVTLAQAICCQVPVICNVSILKEEMPRLHFWEVKPFKRAGVCEMFSKSTKIKKISQKIEELLYNQKIRRKMKKNQLLVFEKGEEKAFEIIKNLIEERL